jgi:hypothetical protein
MAEQAGLPLWSWAMAEQAGLPLWSRTMAEQARLPLWSWAMPEQMGREPAPRARPAWAAVRLRVMAKAPSKCRSPFPQRAARACG